MKSKSMQFLKILVGILLFLTIFFGERKTIIFPVIVLGLTSILLITVVPKIHFHLPNFKRFKKEPTEPEHTDTRTMLLCQLSHRITDKLHSAYADATWDWCRKPNVGRLINGKTERICLSGVPDYTHAEISLDLYGTLYLQFMKIEPFSQAVGKKSAAPAEEPPVVDCHSWYSLVGEPVLSGIITDLNARGFTKLMILENGDISIMEDKTPVVKESLNNFPGKTYWKELSGIFSENGLKAAIQDTALELSGSN